MATENRRDKWERFRRVVADEPLSLALVDLGAFESNVDRLAGLARAGGKTLRVASKSFRCVDLLRRVLNRGAGAVKGLMTYTAAETAFLAEQGFTDFLLAYPTARADDADVLARLNGSGVPAAVVADSPEQLAALSAAGQRAGATIPLVVELDMAWRPLRSRIHIGVRRSPLRSPEEIAEFAARLNESPHLRFHGLMAYESQIAGVPETGSALRRKLVRAMKRASRRQVEEARHRVIERLKILGLTPTVVNGGGTGSLEWSANDPSLTEITAGSGFLAGHLFDHYRGLSVDPALFFALQAVRRPAPGMITCHGGGIIASGEPGPDRLPLPWLPEGLRLLRREGAGEVQTPLLVSGGLKLRLGDPVFFRPAKSGEPAEHFGEYLLVRGDRLESRSKTYRGFGKSFLG
ncbi:MAG: alanine racemase [Nitrospirae bacterium]|nr:alanine racemase [Nitrospirota bacterium]